MTNIRRATGFATILLSILGLALCITSAAGVWLGKSRVDALSAALFGTADDAFAFIETRLDRVNQALDKSRQRVTGLSSVAERMNTTEAGADVRAEFQPLLDEVYSELQAAEHWLDPLQAVAGGVNKVSEAMVMSQTAGSIARDDDGESADVTAKKVAEFSAGVADALARVQAMRQELIDHRENRTLAREFAAAMITRVGELDARLANVSASIDAFKVRVSTARASSLDLGRRVHWWIVVATVTLTLVALWFGVSQIGMMKRGLRLTRPSAALSRPR